MFVQLVACAVNRFFKLFLGLYICVDLEGLPDTFAYHLSTIHINSIFLASFLLVQLIQHWLNIQLNPSVTRKVGWARIANKILSLIKVKQLLRTMIFCLRKYSTNFRVIRLLANICAHFRIFFLFKNSESLSEIPEEEFSLHVILKHPLLNNAKRTIHNFWCGIRISETK